jgi:VIT1/CCC1 family predicted Fe2+/Mn2+ transporter
MPAVLSPPRPGRPQEGRPQEGRPQRSQRSFLLQRGAITGAGTCLGGVLHTLPFLIPEYVPAVVLALTVAALELLALAWIRRRFFGAGFLSSLITVTLAGAIIATISAALGAVF